MNIIINCPDKKRILGLRVISAVLLNMDGMVTAIATNMVELTPVAAKKKFDAVPELI
jgi:hypothetical protein